MPRPSRSSVSATSDFRPVFAVAPPDFASGWPCAWWRIVGVMIVGAMAVTAGIACGSSAETERKAARKTHWFQADAMGAIETQIGLDAPNPDELASALGYAVKAPMPNFLTDAFDMNGVKTAIEAVVMPIPNRLDTVRIRLTASGSDAEFMQKWSDLTVRDLELAFGESTSSSFPTGTPPTVQVPTQRAQSWARGGGWVVSFDPAAYRSVFVVELLYDPNERHIPRLPTVRRPRPDTEPSRDTTGSSGGPTDTSGSGSTSTPAPTATVESPPKDADEDWQFFEMMHRKFVAACNRESWAPELRTRKIIRNGREWLIDHASEKGLHCVGGGGVTAVFAWDRLAADAVLTGYRDLTKRTLADEFGIVAYCYRHGLVARADDTLKRLLDRENNRPEFKAAVDAFIARQRKIAVPAGGFLLHRFAGSSWRFITPDEKANIELAEKVDALLKQIERATGSSRGSAWNSLEAAVAELAQLPTHARLSALELLRDHRAKALEKLANVNVSSDLRRSLYQQLQAARQAAVQAIYDTALYPDDNHGAAGQPAVNERVDLVRQLWSDPFAVIERTMPDLATQKQRLDDLTNLMRQLDPGGALMPIEPVEPVLAEIRQAVNAQIDLRRMSGERALAERVAEVERDNRQGRSDATAREVEFVTVLNNYRWMLGREPLRVNSRLTVASRKHGDYMKATGQFAHVIAGHPDGDSPSDRARRAGYAGGVGENITMASHGHSPQSAFDSWYNSAPHHRNMLNDRYRVIGAGDSGSHWVTKFGNGTDGSEPRAR